MASRDVDWWLCYRPLGFGSSNQAALLEVWCAAFTSLATEGGVESWNIRGEQKKEPVKHP